MSSAEIASVVRGGSAPQRYRGAFLRLYRGEMRLLLTRRRNLILLALVVWDISRADGARGQGTGVGLAAAIKLTPLIFIPYLWWHHVRSVDRINMLVNYWWTPTGEARGAPRDAFLHAMLAIRTLPKAHRDAWRTRPEVEANLESKDSY